MLPFDRNSPEFSTPMMLQYAAIKEKYSDCILLFRLGDFYEMFMEDAKLGASLLDIALTSRDRGKDGRIPMAGIPFHALDSYISKFIKAGYKVAICEQLGDTKQPGLVERDVVRVITPGTLVEESVLNKRENNYILAIHLERENFGIALADISTGAFYADEFSRKDFNQIIVNWLIKYNPSECLMSPKLYNSPDILKALKLHKFMSIFPYFDWDSSTSGADQKLREHFALHSLSAVGILDLKSAQKASSALLSYLKYSLKAEISHIRKLSRISDASYMSLDRATIQNLELFSTLRDGETKGTLLDYMDLTITAMGARLLKDWLIKPLSNIEGINSRLDSVTELIEKFSVTELLRANMRNLMDMERILSRLAVNAGSPKDLINLATSILSSGELKISTKDLESACIRDIKAKLRDDFLKIADTILNYVEIDAPFDPKSGGFIRSGVNAGLDALRTEVSASKKFLADLELSERQRTGISSLKVRYNQVFGYYIEVTKSNLDLVPTEYIRKQTMVNAERFITPEIKKHEDIILTAQEKLQEIEYQLFLRLVKDVLDRTELIQDACKGIAELDCLCTLAVLAKHKNLVRPEIENTTVLQIRGGRHPVVESLLPSGEFIKNDTELDTQENQLMVITGPNMAGKSVYIRQVGIITLMAHIGSYVPAEAVKVGIVDKLFVRSGASDVITAGLSTFMVEMTETAYILNNCTDRSLIIMDEIGRGTSTYDGISIAWAVAEYLVTTPGNAPKTLFATHYHELQRLEDLYPGKIRNLQVLVENTDSGPVFLHKVAEGAARHSYGVEVAKLAGVPDSVYRKALEVLSQLKLRVPNEDRELVPLDVSFDLRNRDEVLLFKNKIKDLDIGATTPLEALNILAELKQIMIRHSEDVD